MHRLRRGARTTAAVVLALWLVFGVNALLGGALFTYGIRPREPSSWPGLLTAPLLHIDVRHLGFNSASLLLIAPFTMLWSRRNYWRLTAWSALWAGMGAWLLGEPGTVHIGASGVVFGHLGFLMTRGLFDRRPGPLLVSLLVAWAFGQMLQGVLPTVGSSVSWQAHLFGCVAGVSVAASLRRPRR